MVSVHTIYCAIPVTCTLYIYQNWKKQLLLLSLHNVMRFLSRYNHILVSVWYSSTFLFFIFHSSLLIAWRISLFLFCSLLPFLIIFDAVALRKCKKTPLCLCLPSEMQNDVTKIVDDNYLHSYILQIKLIS